MDSLTSAIAKPPPVLPQRSTRIVWIVLLLSIIFSITLLAKRNIYDDEFSTLQYVNLPLHQIITRANTEDVHPPGMYILDHLSYELFKSARWLVIGELLFFYAGLGIFLLRITPLLRTRTEQLCFATLAAFHPELLMWGNTNRWYGWWTGLALLTLVVALQPGKPKNDELSWRRTLAIGMLCAALFYINYITILFAAALTAALLYRWGTRALAKICAALAIAVFLVVPQVHAFLTVHLAAAPDQRSGILSSTLHLGYALLISEAVLPWHPVAAAIAALWIVFAVIAWHKRTEIIATLRSSYIVPLILFAAVFALAIAISGLGVKPRSGILLAPLGALLVALTIGTIPPEAIRATYLAVLAAWITTGATHLLLRQHLDKGSMISRPDDLVRYVAWREQGRCALVITYDDQVALAFGTSPSIGIPIFTPSQANPAVTFAVEPSFAKCAQIDLYWVDSYRGGYGDIADQWQSQMDHAEQIFGTTIAHTPLSYDADAKMKRRLSWVDGATTVPDYRYQIVVTQSLSLPTEKLQEMLPDFRFTNNPRAN